MSRQLWMAGVLTVGFLLACSGAEMPGTPAPPAPAAASGGDADDDGTADGAADGDDAEDGDADPSEADAGAVEDDDGDVEPTDAADAACCLYDGPMGETHALVDDEAACTSEFADKNPRMVAGPECVPVCCRFTPADAEPGEGTGHAVLATGDCTLRKGAVVEFGPGTCADPDAPAPSPAPRPRPKPTAAPVVIPPLTRPGTDGGRGRGGNRPAPQSPTPRWWGRRPDPSRRLM